MTYRFLAVYGAAVLLNAEALKTIRERSGHTQLSLAKASGVAQSRISEIESTSGGFTDVRPGTVKKLADTLAIPMAALLGAPVEAAS